MKRAPLHCEHGVARDTAQRGHSLIELMISITLGLFVVAAGLSLLMTASNAYRVNDDDARLFESGRFAIETISRAARQASYQNLDSSEVPIVVMDTNSPNIEGDDDRTYIPDELNLPFRPPALHAMREFHSDILRLRFFGASNSDPAPTADGTVTNCKGEAVKGVQTQAAVEDGRGWSIFYVKASGTASRSNPNQQPELHCATFKADGSFDSTPIASGVESFQVLYGIDETGAGVPTRFLSADALTRLPCGQKCWKQLVALKVSLLIRGDTVQRADDPNLKTMMFGKVYDDLIGDTDAGAQYDEATLSAKEKSHSRKAFVTTIQLRNKTDDAAVAEQKP